MGFKKNLSFHTDLQVLEFHRPSKFLCQTSGRQNHYSLISRLIDRRPLAITFWATLQDFRYFVIEISEVVEIREQQQIDSQS
jgi:hypothetical protein